MNEKFTFSTKSNTLKFLKSRLKLSSIEKIYDFTVEEWKSNHKQIILNIQSNFNEQIIIRSSAIGEDSKTNSFAGAYESVLNIDSKSSNQIVQAVNSVADSYRVQGNLNLQNQILIQNQTSNVFLNGVLRILIVFRIYFLCFTISLLRFTIFQCFKRLARLLTSYHVWLIT